MSREELLALVSHRPPMLLLSGVVETGDKHAVAEVRIAKDSAFFAAPNGVPSWVGIEYMAQTVGVLAGSQARAGGEPVPMGYLLGTRRYRCATEWFADGQVLQIRCEEELFDGNGLGAYNCRIESNGLLAKARLTVYRKPPDD